MKETSTTVGDCGEIMREESVQNANSSKQDGDSAKKKELLLWQAFSKGSASAERFYALDALHIEDERQQAAFKYAAEFGDQEIREKTEALRKLFVKK